MKLSIRLRKLIEIYFGGVIRFILFSSAYLKGAVSDILRDRNRYIYSIFCIIALTGIILWFFRVLNLFGFLPNLHGGSSWFLDFGAYYDAANLYLESKSPYINTGFYYFPLTLIIFLPFSCLSFYQACLFVSIFNIILLLLTTIIISKILIFYDIRLSGSQLGLLFLAVFLTYPISTSFTHGQVNILMLFLISSFYYYLFAQGKLNRASFFLSIAFFFKIWPAVLMFLGFITKNAKGLFLRSCLIIGFLSAISLIVFGISMHIEFLEKFIIFQNITGNTYELIHPNDALDTNASIFNSITKILLVFGLANYYCLKILFGIKLIFISYFSYFLYKSSRELAEREGNILMFSSLIILVLMASNRTWLYYASFLVLSYILYIFVLELDILERLILIVSIALFSIQEYVVFFSNTLGEYLRLLVYIASPTTLAYILFLILTLHIIIRMKNEQNKEAVSDWRGPRRVGNDTTGGPSS